MLLVPLLKLSKLQELEEHCVTKIKMYDGFQNYKYLSNQKWLFPQVKQARNIIRKWQSDRISSNICMEAKCFGRESLIWIFVPFEVKQFLS